METTIRRKEVSLAEYIWSPINDGDSVIQAIRCSNVYTKPECGVQEWKIQQADKKVQGWKEKILHGQFPRQVDETTTEECAYKWMRKSGLKVETESLIVAAQDQALNTKCHKAKILHVTQDSKCRLCKEQDETVTHILSAFKKIAQMEYLSRHNNGASIVHRSICQSFQLPVHSKRWLHKPDTVCQNEDAKILWDMDIQTDRVIPARRPDIIVMDQKRREAVIIDIAEPSDRKCQEREQDKIEKYQDLRLEIQKLWNVKATVVPVVIGALGSHSPHLSQYLEKIPGCHDIAKLVRAALLGSAHILRKTLNLPENG